MQGCRERVVGVRQLSGLTSTRATRRPSTELKPPQDVQRCRATVDASQASNRARVARHASCLSLPTRPKPRAVSTRWHGTMCAPQTGSDSPRPPSPPPSFACASSSSFTSLITCKISHTRNSQCHRVSAELCTSWLSTACRCASEWQPAGAPTRTRRQKHLAERQR
jgi:hypothetical protein